MTVLRKTCTNELNNLEFLRDGKGIYGLSYHGENDTWHRVYVVRPDKDPGADLSNAALHPIPNTPIFCWSLESHLMNYLAETLHRRAGFEGERREGFQWWADNERDRGANRKLYHGQKVLARRVVNHMIGRLIDEAADANVLKAARRFRLRDRGLIYCNAARSTRILQLTDTFPVLAHAIYGRHFNEGWCKEAHSMVERGASLKSIAGLAQIPMALRHVKPGAAPYAYRCVADIRGKSDLVHAYLPKGMAAQRRWFMALYQVRKYGPPLIEWAARNVDQMPGKTLLGITGQIGNIADWVSASYSAAVPDHVLNVITDGRYCRGGPDRLVTRQFSPDMSLATVMRLSDEWHEAVADKDMCGPNFTFPAPWLPAASIDGYDIAPITNAADLYLEGKKMRHCVATYSERVKSSRLYVYSVTANEQKVATVAIIWDGSKYRLDQVAGPCNANVSEEILKSLRRWLRENKDAPAPIRSKRDDFNDSGFGAGPAAVSAPEPAQGADDLDAEISF